ncbi:16S rRNA (cytidine(1402)-2'-O)-methyltransferase [Amphibacillus sp. MSJ-3]|uniref:16S rRNA (cytidine(1402)-2'-O)-methyltransferase n=1 Tax=Amphibacillus sp. MSJ-3 TaxID=2841505 RepID=UPI001C0EDA9F|nr:16S rRNA (cytidine(1402)-2'-O)-methyltransferase [Amphibacillus sp. MSJ-3]MBU5594402.1 16S rRNA (cytidine(1402)-2'-O)-methyltransferase [Amphibacillus sp. MSJ-3]
MKIQKSYHDNGRTGILYIVPTPIGNLDDLTIRALNTLRQVHLIAAEDTRNTKKLLSHFDIHCPLTSYHEHSQQSKQEYLLNVLKKGQHLALVSDAGMPGISDPGTLLIQSAIEEEIPVVVLPGANAALCGLVGSGLPTDQFYFYGFLPKKNKERKKAWQILKAQQATLILYESPYRLKDTLMDIKENLGNRKIALARELTKKFEEYVRGTVEELIEWSESGMVKGEFCIIIEGSLAQVDENQSWWEELTIIEHVDYYIETDQLTSKEAIRKVAQDRELKKRDIYQQYHVD